MTDEATENAIAKIIYDAMRWAYQSAGGEMPPAWEPWGNSDAQTEARSRARESIAAMGDGWQPIETAPKDGQSILTYPHYTVIHWSDDGDVLTSTGNGWAGTWIDGIEAFATCEPTHWTPLPKPPAERG